MIYTICLCAFRLHREALKQSATDPKTGVIDVGILTTGVSGSERARRQALAKEIRRLLQGRGKGGSQLKYEAVLAEIKEQSQVVSCVSGSRVPRLNLLGMSRPSWGNVLVLSNRLYE